MDRFKKPNANPKTIENLKVSIYKKAISVSEWDVMGIELGAK